jgi:O-antigen/teichoic acid export membrane protein
MPGRLVRALGADRLFAIIDQGFQGGASILAGIILARALPAADFGAIGVMVGLYYFVAGFHRTAVVLPYITERDHPDAASPRYHADWWGLNLIVAGLIGAALLGLAALVWLVTRTWPGGRWFVEPVLLAAFVTPPLLAADHARRWLYQIRRADLVALASAAFFASMIAVALAAATWAPRAPFGALAWAAAGTAGSLAALAVLRPLPFSRSGSLGCWARNRAFSGWQMLTHIPYAIYSSASVILPIGLIVGPEAAGVFNAARTLTNPATSLVSAVDSTDKPRAARAMIADGVTGVARSVARTRLLLIVLTGSYLALIALFAGPIVAFAFHGRYAGIEPEVRLLAFVFFLMCLNQPSETFLIVLRASRTLLAIRIFAAAATLLALVVGARAGIMGMVAGMTAAQLCTIAIMLVAERRFLRAGR